MNGHDEGMFCAVRNGDDARLSMLLGICDLLIRDDDGRTALMIAAFNGHVDCVRLLVHVSDPLLKNNHGMTAPMIAVEWGHADCASLINGYVAAGTKHPHLKKWHSFRKQTHTHEAPAYEPAHQGNVRCRRIRRRRSHCEASPALRNTRC